jgi:hypothetical protein
MKKPSRQSSLGDVSWPTAEEDFSEPCIRMRFSHLVSISTLIDGRREA